MKHSIEVTLILVGLFFGAQLMGLVITNEYIEEVEVTETGEVNVTWEQLPSIAGMDIERPKIEPSKSVWLIVIAVAIGTVLLLFLIQHRHELLWRLWFFLAVLLCLTIAFGAFMSNIAAFILAFILTYYKLYRPGFVVQNLTELFVYGGLAAIFVPILNKTSMILLLVFISLYDMYAVWKSKHMIKLAKFQTKERIFAGMLIPHDIKKLRKIREKLKKTKKKKEKKKVLKKARIKTAILGGGDVGFPLLFAGVVMKEVGIAKAAVIPVFVTASLLLLLMLGKKNKFYPAMPFLSVGCLAGYGALSILEIILVLL